MVFTTLLSITLATVTATALAPRATEGLATLLPDGALFTAHAPRGLALEDGPIADLVRAGLAERDEQARPPRSGGAEPRDLGERLLVEAAGGELELLRLLLGQEVALGVYDRESGFFFKKTLERRVLFVARAPAAPSLASAYDAFVASLDLADTPVRGKTHAGVRYHQLGGELAFARRADVLLVATQPELLEQALDRLDDLPPPRATDVLARAHFDPALATIDEQSLLVQVGRALHERIHQPLAALLLGGIADTLSAGGVLDAQLVRDGDRVSLDVRQHGATVSWPPIYAPWLASDAPVVGVPVTDRTIAVFTAERDLDAFWRQRESPFGAELVRRLAKADEDLTQVLAGRSFAEDLLLHLDDRLALVVDAPRLAEDGPAPAIALPSACLLVRVTDDDALGSLVQVAFQTILSFVNTDRGQQGQAPFLLEAAVHEGEAITSGRLLPEMAMRGADADAFETNLSPALARAGEWLLLGTSVEQVRALVSSVHAEQTTPSPGNLHLTIDAGLVCDVVVDNRDALVANAIVEEGKDPEQAGEDVDGLLTILSWFESLDLSLLPKHDGGRLQIDVTLAANSPWPARDEPRGDPER